MASRTDSFSAEIRDPTNLLLTRLDGWRHAVNLLQEYTDGLLSLQKANTHGLEKSKKVVSDAPRFDHHSENQTNSDTVPTSGVAAAFEEIRLSTDHLLNHSMQVEEELKSVVSAQLETLKGDIDKHYKSLKGPGLKAQKEVEKSRTNTHRAVDTLGQHLSSFSTYGKADVKHEPYLAHRLALNALGDQVLKENSNANALASSQANLESLEQHIIQVIQQATTVLKNIMTSYYEDKTGSLSAIATKFSNVSPEHEWQLFSQTNQDQLIPQDAAQRDSELIAFPNRDHEATVPILEGILELKSGKLVKTYSSGYFVLTPTKFLHKFKSADYLQDPEPEFSLYLPDCVVGYAVQEKAKFKFTISGKDSQKAITTKHKFSFRAGTSKELAAWHEAIGRVAGASPDAEDEDVNASDSDSASVGQSDTAQTPATLSPQAATSQLSPLTPIEQPTQQPAIRSTTADVPVQELSPPPDHAKLAAQTAMPQTQQLHAQPDPVVLQSVPEVLEPVVQYSTQPVSETVESLVPNE